VAAAWMVVADVSGGEATDWEVGAAGGVVMVA
jgi:hypothetical protein